MPTQDAIRKRRERREARQNAADEAKAQEQQQKSDAKNYKNGMPFQQLQEELVLVKCQCSIHKTCSWKTKRMA